MSRDDRLVALKQVGHLGKRQPGGLALEADLDAGATVLGLVEEELGRALGEVGRADPLEALPRSNTCESLMTWPAMSDSTNQLWDE